MRVLVCGGRNYSNWKLVKKTLDALHAKAPISKIIHGGCRFANDPAGYYRGADGLAHRWSKVNKMRPDVYEADWGQGRGAGPRRNGTMLKQSKPDLVVAFKGGAGTADMVRKARAALVTVMEIEDET